MFTEIRKPKLLKDVPMLLIRALPSIYYYQRYKSENPQPANTSLYESNLMYLSRAMRMIAKGTAKDEFLELAHQTETMLTESNPQSERLAQDLAELCTTHKSELRAYLKSNRDCIRQLYREVVQSLQILLISYDGQSQDLNKLKNILENFCLYTTSDTSPSAFDFGKQVVDSDFGIFTSTIPARIHNDIKVLKSYKRPGLAIAGFEEGRTKNVKSVRHGSQLIKIGFPVLFKVYTPLRLFTSIDKEYMRFHANKAVS